jgi:oligosaccharide repeat unit polymerase
LLYELKLIKYYDLSLTTWTVIFVMQILYVLGCYTAIKITKHGGKSLLLNKNRKVQKLIMRIIVIITLVSGTVIIVNITQYFRMFGYDLLSQTNELYSFRLTGSEGINKIPYIGVFMFIALIFSAIYTTQYGFKKFFIVPIVLIVLEELTSGGRASLILAPLMFIGVLFATEIKKTNFSKMQIGLVLTLVGVLFFMISSNRTAGTDNSYSSEFLSRMTNGNNTVYKLIEYITSPVGTLNAYLENPTFSFGQNTFLTLYNFLNKIGYNIEIPLYQENYYVPMRVNVGTMLREIIEDFTIAGAALVIFLVGFCFSRSYLKFKTTSSYVYGIWVAVLFQTVCFSFFDWRFRSSAEWIVLLFGTLLGLYIDRKIELISIRNTPRL